MFQLLVVSLLLCGCSDNTKKTVVLYSSVDEGYSRQVAKLFEEQSGIEVKLVSDTEATKSTGLVNRLIAEQKRPVADVFWSGDVMRAALLKKIGMSEVYESSGGTNQNYNDSDHAFSCASGRLRLIIYNKDRVSDSSKRPQSVTDLAKPEYANDACLANPLFGTTSMHAALLFDQLGPDVAKQFFTQFTANGGTMLSSNGEVRRRVASGEFAFGLTDSDDISVALADGKPVGYIVPDQGESDLGAVMIPCAAVLIKNGPNPEAARELVDFLVSEEVERYLAKSVAAHFPLSLDLPDPETMGFGLDEVKVMEVEYSRLAELTAELQDGFLKEWTQSQSR